MSPQLLQHLCWGELCCVSGRWKESTLANKVCKACFHLFLVCVPLGHHLVSAVEGAELPIAAPGFPHGVWVGQASLPCQDIPARLAAAPLGAEGSRYEQAIQQLRERRHTGNAACCSSPIFINSYKASSELGSRMKVIAILTQTLIRLISF